MERTQKGNGRTDGRPGRQTDGRNSVKYRFLKDRSRSLEMFLNKKKKKKKKKKRKKHFIPYTLNSSFIRNMELNDLRKVICLRKSS